MQPMEGTVDDPSKHQKTYILSGNRIIEYTYEQYRLWDPTEKQKKAGWAEGDIMEDEESFYLQFTTEEAAEHWLHNSIDDDEDDWIITEGIRDHAGHGPTTRSVIERRRQRVELGISKRRLALARTHNYVFKKSRVPSDLYQSIAEEVTSQMMNRRSPYRRSPLRRSPYRRSPL